MRWLRSSEPGPSFSTRTETNKSIFSFRDLSFTTWIKVWEPFGFGWEMGLFYFSPSFQTKSMMGIHPELTDLWLQGQQLLLPFSKVQNEILPLFIEKIESGGRRSSGSSSTQKYEEGKAGILHWHFRKELYIVLIGNINVSGWTWLQQEGKLQVGFTKYRAWKGASPWVLPFSQRDVIHQHLPPLASWQSSLIISI